MKRLKSATVTISTYEHTHNLAGYAIVYFIQCILVCSFFCIISQVIVELLPFSIHHMMLSNRCLAITRKLYYDDARCVPCSFKAHTRTRTHNRVTFFFHFHSVLSRYSVFILRVDKKRETRIVWRVRRISQNMNNILQFIHFSDTGVGTQ